MLRLADFPAHSAVIEHNAFGRAGRTARINDRRQIVRSNGFAAFFEQSFAVLFQQLFADGQHVDEEMQFDLAAQRRFVFFQFADLRRRINHDHVLYVR